MIEISGNSKNCEGCVFKKQEPYRIPILTLDPEDRYFLNCSALRKPIEQIAYCPTGPLTTKPSLKMPLWEIAA